MKRIFTILLILIGFNAFSQVGGTNYSGGGNYVFLPICDQVSPGVFKPFLRLFNVGTGKTMKYVDADMVTHEIVDIADSGCAANVMVRGTFSTNKNKACYAKDDDTLEGYLITIYIDSVKSTTVIEDLSGDVVSGAIEVRGSFCSQPVNVSVNQNLDAFQRLRVSNPVELFDATHLYDKQAHIFDEITTGTGTSVHNSDESVVDMTVSNSGDTVLRQSYRYITYRPGESFLISLTGVLSSTQTEDVNSKIGLFDDVGNKIIDQGGNGYYFEYLNDSLFIVERSSVTGSQIDNKIFSDDWNMATPSIDVTKANIFMIDAQWLGAGRVRMGFNLNGSIIWVHQFMHANMLPTTYVARISLPVRYEITQTGETGSTMKMICASIVSEGGFNLEGRLRSTNVASINLTNGVESFVLAIRVKPSYNRMSNNIRSLSMINTNASRILIRVYIVNATIGGAFSSIPNSGSEQNTTFTGFSGGVLLSSSYSPGTVRSLSFDVDNEKLLTGADIEGNPQSIVITMTPAINTTAFLTADWQEIY